MRDRTPDAPLIHPAAGGPEFAAAPARALVVRLSPARDVDRSCTHSALAAALDRGLPGIFVDYAFPPGAAARRDSAAGEWPPLAGARSGRGPGEFDLVLVSCSFVLELLNLPALLRGSGLPLLASERAAGFPPLLLGGSSAAACRAVIAPDGDAIPDALFFGEGERAVAGLARRLPDLEKSGGAPAKAAWLRDASREIPGLWCAGHDAAPTAERSILRDPAAAEIAPAGPVIDSPEAGKCRLFVNAGCAAFCVFCFEGYDRKPYREADAAAILDAARAAKIALGAREAEIAGFNANTHRDLFALIETLADRFERVTLKSQRADLLARTPGMLDAEFAIGKSSFTLGVEGASARLRARLRKSLSTADLRDVLARLLAPGAPVREVKLFFLVTCWETGDDLAEMAELLEEVAHRRKTGNGARVIVSAGYLVRMPGTPLSADPPLFSEARLRDAAARMERASTAAGLEFRLAADFAEYACTQALALAGPWGLDALRRLDEAGCRYIGRLSRDAWPVLSEFLAARGILRDGEFVPGRPPGPELSGGCLPDFLDRAYRSSLAGEDPGYCLGDACRACGACGGEARPTMIRHRIAPPDPGYLERLRATMHRKRRLVPLVCDATLPAAWDGAGREALAALLLRELLAAWPEEADNLLVAEEALLTRGDRRDRFPHFHGRTVVSLTAWDTERLAGRMGDGRPLELAPRAGGAPDGFAALDLLVELPAASPRVAEAALERLLAAARVPHHCEGKAGARRIVVAPKGTKRAILSGARLPETGAGGSRLEISALSKFDLAALRRELGEAARGATACVRALRAP